MAGKGREETPSLEREDDGENLVTQPDYEGTRMACDQLCLMVVLPVALLFLLFLGAMLSSFWWKAFGALSHPFYDGMGFAPVESIFLGTFIGLAFWGLAWLSRDQRRSSLTFLILMLPVALVAQQLMLISVAWDTNASIRPHAADEELDAAKEAKRKARALSYWRQVPDWLKSLESGGEAWLAPTFSDEWIEWRGTRFRIDAAPEGPQPIRKKEFYVVTADATRLLVLVEPLERIKSYTYDLVELRTDTRPRLLAEKVNSAVAAPDGVGYAYTTKERIVLNPADGPSSSLRKMDHTVTAWRAEGLYVRHGPDENSKIEVVRMPDLTEDQTTLFMVSGTSSLRIPPTGNYAFQPACTGYFKGSSQFSTRPYIGFETEVWPATLPLLSGRCPGVGTVYSLSGGSAPVLEKINAPMAENIVDLSPDGRYLVSAGLQVTDLTTGTLSSLVDPATRNLLLNIRNGLWIDPIGTGFWHDRRTVEITAGGSPVAVCVLPSGPCRSTGLPLPIKQV
jgi:hypothetical protein